MPPQEATATQPQCFAIMPFGQRGSPQERHYTQVYQRIIQMPVTEAGFVCKRGDEIAGFGPVTDQVISGLRTADLVIADLSEGNPNVFYELGVRQALDRPLLTIAGDDPQNLPFSVRTLRIHRYSLTDVAIADDCRNQIRREAEEIKQRLTDGSLKAGSSEQSVTRLEDIVTAGFANLSQLVSEQARKAPDLGIGDQLGRLGRQVAAQDDRLQELQNSVSATTALMRAADSGLMGVYPNRLEAIERDFFRMMQSETTGISIVGSTIFGLKGSQQVSSADILGLLSSKASDPAFKLRLLLTHWDCINYRQDQEMESKALARVVIAKELLDAATTLAKHGLQPYVKFYRGSPTCFTIVCEGQKVMLVNPYPYEREAFNSWTAVFRHVPSGVYADFVDSHVDHPWSNQRLTVEMDAECEREIKARYDADMLQATEDIRSSLPVGSGQTMQRPSGRTAAGYAGDAKPPG